MAELTVQTILESGLSATYSSADVAGDFFNNPNDQETFFLIKNGDGSDHTVTVVAQNTSSTKPGYGVLTKSDQVIVVTAGEERVIGPFPDKAFNDANGDVQITYDAVTSVTIAALRLVNV